MRRGIALLAALTILLPLYAQDWISLHRKDEAKWAQTTGMSSFAIHRLWRSTSHFADEQQDDSHIEVLDTKSLADQKQVLLVTSAGEPRCLTLAVFSKVTGFMKVWSADSTPNGDGFCDKLGLPVRIAVTKSGIEVFVPQEPLNRRPSASHADVEHWVYHWTGKTYLTGQKSTELEYLPH
jgi:hypothetical protein